MAEAYGKLTGRPGICFVTRGPGATNASIGVHTASQDSTPMILLIGQVARFALEREAFQEIDYRRMFGQMSKWVAQVDDPRRIPELVSHAFHLAVSGRPGPVVLALPEDVLAEECETEDAAHYQVVQAHPGASDLARIGELLAVAERPLAIVGGGGWSRQASSDLLAFLEASGVPAAASFRCQDYVDNLSPVYVGDVGLGINPKLAQRIRDCDLLLVIGSRLGEATTQGYELVGIPRPAQGFVHVHPGAEELGRVYQGDLLVNSGLPQFCAALEQLGPVDGSRWAEWRAAARSDYEQHIAPVPAPGSLNVSEVVVHLRETLARDAILANGAGNFTVWAHRFARFTEFGTQACPRSGSMGYGLAAAVAAKLIHPDRVVVCFTGDGDFVMSSPELATAVQYELPIVILLVNNGMYATIRMHQERQFPGRVVGTDLENPDFPALARAYGAHAERVGRTEDFGAAFERALASGKPAVLELPVDPERISPRVKLSELRTGVA
jgi:acetolactate synthase-1/2/3 large subunit